MVSRDCYGIEGFGTWTRSRVDYSMRPSKRLLLSAVGFMFLILVALGIRSGLFISAWMDYVLRAPRLEVPALLDFGTQERGSVAQLRFDVRNAGAGRLVLDEFASSCSCQVIEQSGNDGTFRAERVELAPDEIAPLFVRLGVQGIPGSKLETSVSFRSNDPSRPEVSIPIVVRKVGGGLLILPRTVDFGRVVAGKQARRTVELRDDALTLRTVRGVMVAAGTRSFIARFAPVSRPKTTAEETSVLLGTVETIVNAKEPGLVKGELEIFLNERRSADKVPLIAEVVPLVEAFPPEVVLPRASSTGALFSAECLVQTNDGSVLELLPPKSVGAAEVEIAAVAGRPHNKLVRIKWKGSALRPAAEKLSFQARAGKTSCALEVVVRLEPGRAK